MTQLVTIQSKTTPERPITLDQSAVNKVAELVSEETEDVFLRVAVRPGGCSGFSYEMAFDTTVEEDDKVEAYTADDGSEIRVAVDPASAEKIAGSRLSYHDELNRAGFSVENPNVARTCGCGNSFA